MGLEHCTELVRCIPDLFPSPKSVFSLWSNSDNNIECLGGTKGSLFSLQGIIEALSLLVTSERFSVDEFEPIEPTSGGVEEQSRTRTLVVSTFETAEETIGKEEQLKVESLTAIICLLHRIASELKRKASGTSNAKWRQAFILKHQNVEVLEIYCTTLSKD